MIVGTWVKTLQVDTQYTNGDTIVFSSINNTDPYWRNYEFTYMGIGSYSQDQRKFQTFNYNIANSKIYFSNVTVVIYSPGHLPSYFLDLRKLTDTEFVVRVDTTYTNSFNLIERDISDSHYKRSVK